jgi:hypothetical protein
MLDKRLLDAYHHESVLTVAMNRRGFTRNAEVWLAAYRRVQQLRRELEAEGGDRQPRLYWWGYAAGGSAEVILLDRPEVVVGCRRVPCDLDGVPLEGQPEQPQ